MSDTCTSARLPAVGEGSGSRSPEWLRIAAAEIGVREISGPRANPVIATYYRDAGHAEVVEDEVPWCAAFVGACLARSGLQGTRSLMARSYLEWGRTLGEPVPGAIAVLSRGSDPALGHVGFWLGSEGEEIDLLGGNQSDAVSRARFPRAQVLGYRWPSPTKADGAALQQSELFEISLKHVLEMEGGWSEDPFDPGGPTNKGITLKDLIEHFQLDAEPATLAGAKERLRRLDEGTARAIYRERYWQPSAGDRLPAALALMHFDAAVNHGVGTAARMLQEAVGAEVDGEIGPLTLAAAESAELLSSVLAYGRIRRARYRSLSTFWRFGRGWLRRVDATEAAARELMKRAELVPLPTPSEKEQQMANGSVQTTGQDGKWWGHSLTIWGAIVTTLATVAPAFLQAFGIDLPGELIRASGDQIGRLIQALTGVIGILMTIAGRVRARGPIERRAITVRI